MIRLLQFAAILLAVTVAATLLSIAVVVRMLRRRMRPVPHLASSAPLRWLVTSSASARLHRRLRATARASVVTTERIRSSFPDATNLVEVGEALGFEASRIERALVEVEPMTGSHRREAIQALDARVRKLDASTERYCHAVDDWSDAVDAHGKRQLDVDDALRSIEEATRTLRQLHVPSDDLLTAGTNGAAPRSSSRS